jgi:hypothetical protein
VTKEGDEKRRTLIPLEPQLNHRDNFMYKLSHSIFDIAQIFSTHDAIIIGGQNVILKLFKLLIEEKKEREREKDIYRFYFFHIFNNQ